jgi:hypothetical protein
MVTFDRPYLVLVTVKATVEAPFLAGVTHPTVG